MHKRLENPFIITGRYVSDDYFCDREAETKELVSNIKNWRNSVLVSPRRMGKSGLVEHTFVQPEIATGYETFYVDVYATSTLDDFVLLLGKDITARLQSKGSKLVERFLTIVSSLKATFTTDQFTGLPALELSLGEMQSSMKTLEQIFQFLETSDKPCVVAIDEFQQIADYEDGKKVIATLRTLVQGCKQTRFIFAGSNRRMMDVLFNSPSEPFFMSCSPVSLGPIDKTKYREFSISLFNGYKKNLSVDCFDMVYDYFEGHTWYVQYVLNRLFEMTAETETAGREMVGEAIEHILGVFNVTYQNILSNYSERQRALLIAVAKERRVQGILSGEFVKKYRLNSASSVQGALKALLDNETIVRDGETYRIDNHFFSIWLSRR